eukprot:204719-Prymnesium_polylepis.2
MALANPSQPQPTPANPSQPQPTPGSPRQPQAAPGSPRQPQPHLRREDGGVALRRRRGLSVGGDLQKEGGGGG